MRRMSAGPLVFLLCVMAMCVVWIVVVIATNVAETQQMKACVESGQHWSQGECSP